VNEFFSGFFIRFFVWRHHRKQRNRIRSRTLKEIGEDEDSETELTPPSQTSRAVAITMEDDDQDLENFDEADGVLVQGGK
jgi:Flp pilus assembly protein TadB